MRGANGVRSEVTKRCEYLGEEQLVAVSLLVVNTVLTS